MHIEDENLEERTVTVSDSKTDSDWHLFIDESISSNDTQLDAKIDYCFKKQPI